MPGAHCRARHTTWGFRPCGSVVAQAAYMRTGLFGLDAGHTDSSALAKARDLPCKALKLPNMDTERHGSLVHGTGEAAHVRQRCLSSSSCTAIRALQGSSAVASSSFAARKPPLAACLYMLPFCSINCRGAQGAAIRVDAAHTATTKKRAWGRRQVKHDLAAGFKQLGQRPGEGKGGTHLVGKDGRRGHPKLAAGCKQPGQMPGKGTGGTHLVGKDGREGHAQQHLTRAGVPRRAQLPPAALLARRDLHPELACAPSAGPSSATGHGFCLREACKNAVAPKQSC